MAGIGFNLNAISEYISLTKTDCIKIQNQQIAMEIAYKNLGAYWSDTIYVDVGVVLYHTAKGMGRMYQGMINSVKAATEFYNRLSQLERTGNSISSVIIPEYKFTLTEVPTMPKNEGFVSAELLRQFIVSLQNYVYETEYSVIRVKNRYADMRQYWSGDQYNQFGYVINSAEAEIRKQLRELSSLGATLGVKYKELVAIEALNINKNN